MRTVDLGSRWTLLRRPMLLLALASAVDEALVSSSGCPRLLCLDEKAAGKYLSGAAHVVSRPVTKRSFSGIR
jgi:hypothetical protein